MCRRGPFLLLHREMIRKKKKKKVLECRVWKEEKRQQMGAPRGVGVAQESEGGERVMLGLSPLQEGN